MLRTIQYNCQSGEPFKIDETADLLIIRTLKYTDPDYILKTIPGIKAFWRNIRKHDQFPDSSVFLYQIVETTEPSLLRDELKNIIEKYNHPNICYAGTVMRYADSGVYQIYTGNLFIKFQDSASTHSINSIIRNHKLDVKRDLPFARNSFFVAPHDDIGRDIFDLSMELLRYKDVSHCHPELVVKRKYVFRNIPVDTNTASKIPQNWVFDKINLNKAWKYTRGENIRICVIDDGLDFGHPAFSSSGKIAAYRDMLDSTKTKKPVHHTGEMHGTACAGIACSNDFRAPGIAPGAQLMPVRSVGLGSVTESEAFYWAVQNKADIISCSWGPPDGDFTSNKKNNFVYPIPDHTDFAIRYAATRGRNGKGCLIFFAAGNGNESIKLDKYASHPYVMAIGASNMNDEKTSYSDYDSPIFCTFPSGEYVNDGKGWKQINGVTVPDPTGKDGYDDTDIFKLFSGTSASCPGMAGTAALLLSLRPDLTRLQAKDILSKSCKPLGKSITSNLSTYDDQFGFGLIQTDLVIQNALKFNKTAMDNESKTQTKGYSLHIGINEVSAEYYGDIVPKLYGCIKDMQKMKSLAVKLGYQTKTLENEAATSSRILDEIKSLSETAKPGDMVLITYAGHGAPIIDENNDEPDGYDEAWVTYDGFLIDDKIYQSFQEFKKGVKILVVTDSCHNGTVTRLVNFNKYKKRSLRGDIRYRFLELDLVNQILSRNGQTQRSLKITEKKKDKSSKTGQIELNVPVKLLAACADDQVAGENQNGGLFTYHLIETFNNFNNSITYTSLIDNVKTRMPSSQQPQITDEGLTDNEFDALMAFSIEASRKEHEILQAEIPVVELKRSSIIAVETDEMFLNLSSSSSLRSTGPENSDVLKVVDGKVDGESIAGETDWDKAYNLYFSNQDKNIEFIEAYLPPESYEDRFYAGRDTELKESDEFDWLKTYPPYSDIHKNVPFDWHLDNEHSQLKAAREIVYPELITGDTYDKSKPNVYIAHIDTGILEDHPSKPENLILKVTADNDTIITGAEDKDVITPGEQQGHGNATLAILAGGKLMGTQTGGEFSGYFGAIPFAKVVTIKVSDYVVLLSGKRVAEAIEYAITLGVDVITMSMAGLPSKAMAKAVNKAYEAGIVICSAASNSWVKGLKKAAPDCMLYPARFDRTIGVVGATYTQVPYVYKLHNTETRTAGGCYMQMSYGPRAAMNTAIAGYTPNIAWFEVDMKKEKGKLPFVKNGGGTSSATPQVAAAAALYIQKYRDEIEKIAGKDKWKKVEIVKAALFKSAHKLNDYSEFYGNGILRAKNALMIEPKDIELPKEKAPEAKDEGSFLKSLFFVFRRSLIDNQHDQKLTQMMNTELMQLMHREPELFPLLKNYNFSDPKEELTYDDRILLIDVVQRSKLASSFLKSNIVTKKMPDSPAITRGVTIDSFHINSLELESLYGNYNLRSSGIKYVIKSFRKNIGEENFNLDLSVDEIELEINGPLTRDANTSLNLITNFTKNDRQCAILVEKELDGETVAEWVFDQPIQNQTSRDFSFNRNGRDGNQFTIDFSDHLPNTNRNLFSKIGKVLIKVISWLSPQDEQAGNFKEWLARMGKSRYMVMGYDLESSTNRWINLDKKAEMWDAISKDSKPVLLLFPGLFRDVTENFTDLLSNSAILEALKNKYSRYVIGFNMPDIIAGIEENAKGIHDLLPKELLNKQSVVIARSRGGLVSRYLFENLWDGKKPDKYPFKLQKMILVGTPNEGTPIASNKKWKDLVNVITNILGKALVIGGPVFSSIQMVVAAIVNRVTDLDGINDLEVKSDVLMKLNSNLNVAKNNYYVVTSDYEPQNSILRFLEEIAVDRYIFTGITNDGVVPVKSAICESINKTAFIPEINRLLLGASERTHHFQYLNPENTRTINWITSILLKPDPKLNGEAREEEHLEEVAG